MAKPWALPPLIPKSMYVRHDKFDAEAFDLMELRGHVLLVAPILGATQEALHPSAVIMCKRCGAYAHSATRKLAFPCTGSFGITREAKRRLKQFLAGLHPRHGNDDRLGTPTSCTPAAYLFLMQRWKRLPGPKPSVDEGCCDLSSWGTAAWREALARSVGATLEEVRSLGEWKRLRREARAKARQRGRVVASASSDDEA